MGYLRGKWLLYDCICLWNPPAAHIHFRACGGSCYLLQYCYLCFGKEQGNYLFFEYEEVALRWIGYPGNFKYSIRNSRIFYYKCILVMQIKRGLGLRSKHLSGEDISVPGAIRMLRYGLCVFSDSSLDLSPKLITKHCGTVSSR
ncbi:hypothetical protein DY000_02054710 [Brassica cretica]|uniref:Uncharacterized protein n=1 Tax=Brassica cretica TaxID=69181 RepID=A0ABQ7AJG4_BRACR|nr:hypothetical protein DY000_02054710 [Brassica cretica]